MKSSLLTLLALLPSMVARADPAATCQASVENLIRWSGTDPGEGIKQANIDSCLSGVAAGEIDTIIAAECLANPDLDAALSCMADGIIAASLAQCDVPTPEFNADECRSQIQQQAAVLPEQLKAMILSGQVLQSVPSESPIELPPPPADPGSCPAMIDNMNRWSGKTQSADERTEAIGNCEKQIAEQLEETRLVIMCLSLADLDAASNCLVTEAVRANLSECSKGAPEERSMCEQMLMGIVEPMKTELRNSILDGSFME
jgi:hypothetical protein